MPFDIESARKEGYTDQDIADHLASASKFDVHGAMKEGYSLDDIASHIASKQSKPNYGQQLLGFGGDIANEWKNNANQQDRLFSQIGNMNEGVPVRTARILGAPLALAGQVVGSLGNLAGYAVNRLAGGIPGQLANKMGIPDVMNKIGNTLGLNNLDPEAKDMLPLIGLKGGAAGLGNFEDIATAYQNKTVNVIKWAILHSLGVI